MVRDLSEQHAPVGTMFSTLPQGLTSADFRLTRQQLQFYSNAVPAVRGRILLLGVLIMCLFRIVVIGLAFIWLPEVGAGGMAPSTDQPATKFDDGLPGNDAARHAVFVRMRDQMFRRGGDYERFAAAHGKDDRGVLRREVVTNLHAKSDASWQRVRSVVDTLVADRQLRQVQRYWIVNGFAAVATGKACQALAKLDAVEFIYVQKGISRLQGAPARGAGNPPANLPEARRDIYVKVLRQWHDDSSDPLPADGLVVPWNVARIKADRVWRDENVRGEGVVVALQDSGLMAVPALTRALWKNPREQLNGRDDDGNGFIDDLFGFDVARNSFDVLGDRPRLTHGSMCAGIIAGRPVNKKHLATGIAPRARLMIVRGMGQLRAYEYALANGADIISMSYMMTQPNLGNYRGLFRLAHEHMAAGGLLGVGGAGNFGPGGHPSLPRGHQIALPKDIPCVIAAAGIQQDGKAPAFSSRGPCWWNDVAFYHDYPPAKPLQKPDVTGCIGGYPVWGRPGPRLPRQWTIVSRESARCALVRGPRGNSFSGPHAAGVAALMLSANPQLKPWQIMQLMRATCRDLGTPGWDPVYGAGLLDALAAVRAAKRTRPQKK